MTTKGYNGYPSWNAWNVSLWVHNDEATYKKFQAYIRRWGKAGALKLLTEELDGAETPDGAVYNKTAIREALKGFDNA